MTALRALTALSVLLAFAMLSRCASGGAKSHPTGTAESSSESSVAAPAGGPEAAVEAEPSAASPAVPAATPAAGPAVTVRVDFTAQVLPLLQEKCSPCHFPGGRMYDRLPFDQEGTIRLLGTQLLSRLREPLDQELIRSYLEQP